MEIQTVATFFGFTLTTVGLFNALIFSKLNEIVIERKTKVTRQISECRANIAPEEPQMDRVNEQRRRLLESNIEFLDHYLRERLGYIPTSINRWGFLSLILFFSEILVLQSQDSVPISTETNNGSLVSNVLLILFFAGLIFLGLYVVKFGKYIKTYLSLFAINSPRGRLSFVQVNGQAIEDDRKELRLSFRDLPDRINVRVRLDGDFLNGFIDSHYVYWSQAHNRFEPVWIPDVVTYLSPFSYQDTKLFRIPELDTGILQENIQEEFALWFRLRGFPALEAYDEYRLRARDEIERMEIDIYEDIWHIPNIERRNIKEEKLTIINVDFPRE